MKCSGGNSVALASEDGLDIMQATGRVRTHDPFQAVEGIEIDRLNRRVRRFGRELRLTPKEFDLLTFLVLNAGRTVSRKYLLDTVWHGEEVDIRTVDATVARLRRAINRGFYPDPIKSVLGRGYQFRAGFDRTCSQWQARGNKKLRLPRI